jgi:hypothetical protein
MQTLIEKFVMTPAGDLNCHPDQLGAVLVPERLPVGVVHVLLADAGPIQPSVRTDRPEGV